MNADDLRILILEDSQKDAELIEHELRKGGIAFQSKRVKTRDDFISQLEFFSPQIILADYKLPAFTGIEAFNLIKEKGLDTPFIVVSGTLGEELAIATLKTGVTDYILKDNLQRLAPAVNRALAEIKTALERREALKALQENEKRFKTIATYTYDWENWIGPEGEVFWVNPAVERMTGFSVQEIMAMKDFPASLLADEDRERGLKEFRNAVKNRNPGGGIEIRFRRKDGEIFWGGIAWQQIFDEKGESIGHRSSIRDITKRKQAEEAQRIAYERLRGFIDSNIVGVVIAEAQGKVVEANDYYLNIIEATQEDLKQEKVDWRAITPPEWIPADDKAILELRERGIPISYEKEYIRPDGSRVSVMLSDTMLPGPGELIAAFVLDTTERKQTERALHKSEALYRSLFENMVNGFAYCKMVFDQGRPKDVIFLNVNKTFESLTGLKEVAGKKISELLPGIEEMDPELLETFGRVALTGNSEKFEFYSNALKQWLALSVYSPEKGCFVALFDFITERKRVEQRLRNEYEWKTLLLWLYEKSEQLNDKDLYDYVIEQAVNLTGSSIGFFHLISDDQKTIVLTTWNKEALKNCTASYAMHYSVDEAGNWVDCVRFKKPVMYNDFPNSPNQKGLPEGHAPVRRFLSVPVVEGDKVRFVIGLGNKNEDYDEHDVTMIQLMANDLQSMTRQLSAEKVIRRLAVENATIAEIGRIIGSTLNVEEVYDRFAERVKTLINFDRIAINAINLQNQTISVTYTAGLQIPGRERGASVPAGSIGEELIKEGNGLLFQTEDESEWMRKFPVLQKVYQSGMRSLILVPLRSKGELIGALHLESSRPQYYSEYDLKLAERVGNQIAGAIANAQLFAEHQQLDKEKMNLQTQLQQSQKMEAIGRLAGGVSHDFNNLLTVISIQTQLALRGLEEGDPLKDKLKDVEQAADRAANLTRQLLAFSRRQVMEAKVIQPNFVLKDMEKMLKRVIGEDIELTTHLAEDLGMIKVDPGQMEQVVMNLVVNAKDAMPEGGKLFFETANVDLDQEYAGSHLGILPGAYVMFSITDTGVGMSKEIFEQIFDPFFTTKEKGKGTGLGLSTVYGIVKQSGGEIDVFSEPGKGTAFKIFIPRVFHEPDEIKKGTVAEVPRGKETILVVEDDRMVRKMAVVILKTQGYTVLEASGGGEALIILEKEKRPIQLVLTDVVMPHMKGPELIDRIKKERKECKVLYMTGYTDEAILQEGLREQTINLIHKPFTIKTLSRKVREVLDS